MNIESQSPRLKPCHKFHVNSYFLEGRYFLDLEGKYYNFNTHKKEMEGTKNVLEKLRNSIKIGDFYEAHQMYRSVNRRYAKQKKYTEARQLVQEGAFEFFAAGQFGSGVDLSLLLLDLFNLAEFSVNCDTCGVLVQLARLIPFSHPSRPDFINGVLWYFLCLFSCVSCF